jgi:hypothetical protein
MNKTITSSKTKDDRGIVAKPSTYRAIEPFSLMGNQESLAEKLAEIYQHLPPNSRVIDAYPSTPLQEGLIALSMKQEGTFIPQIICRLPADIDIPRFKSAWQSLPSSKQLGHF